MKSFRLLCASFLALVAGSGLGCILAVGDGEDGSRPNNQLQCSPAGMHSHLDPQNYCTCDTGYGWCTAADAQGGHNCCPLQDNTDTSTTDTNGQSVACASGENNFVGSDGNCYCVDGFDWCSSDINNLNCCSTDDGDTSVHPEESCTPEQEGWDWCSHTAAMGAEGSSYYVCLSGVWTKSPGLADEACREKGSDFAYGCVYDEATDKNQIECGSGPGTPCTAQTPDACAADGNSLTTCVAGRLSVESCVLATGTTCTTANGNPSSLQSCVLSGAKAACICQEDDDSSSSSNTGSDSTSGSSTASDSTASDSTDSTDSSDSTDGTSDDDTGSGTASESTDDDTTSDESSTADDSSTN